MNGQVGIDRLGESSSPISRIILGGPFGREPAADSFAKLDRFRDAGGSLVETSYSYARGASKEILGEWFRANPGSLGVVTKVGHDLRGADIPLERDIVISHVDETLAVLGVETLDVVMYHCDDPRREVGELAETLRHLVSSGRARRVGASNWDAPRLDGLATAFGDAAAPIVASYHRSLAIPDSGLLADLGLHADAQILDVVRSHRMPILSWSAQAQGYFSRSAPRLSDHPDPFDTPASRNRRARAAAIADALGADIGADVIALAWTLHQENTWATIGPTSTAQLDASLAAASITLTASQREWLEGDSAPSSPASEASSIAQPLVAQLHHPLTPEQG